MRTLRYAVSALALVGCSNEASIIWVQPSPAEVSAIALADGARVSWIPAQHADTYKVYVAAGDTVTIESADLVIEDAVSPLDIALTPGDYALLVTAVNREGIEGKPSPQTRVRPFAGGVMPSVDPVLTLAGEVDGDDFGRTVLSPGDINGDGLNDIVVGARHHDAAGLDAGRLYVYFGTPTGLDLVNVQTLDGPAVESRFGHAVVPAGDVNDDGYADVLVAAPGPESNLDYDAVVCLFHGSPTGLEPGVVWSILNNGGQFGYRFSVLNFNGDAFMDLAVGIKSGTNGLANEGAVAVYFGTETGYPGVPDWIAYGGVATGRMGQDISVGDVNGDGIGDILAGADAYDTALNNVGAAMLFLGASGMPSTTPVLTIEGTTASESLGTEVEIANLNGDAFDDMIIGHNGWDEGATLDHGKLTVHYGAETPVPDVGWEVIGEAPELALGLSARRCDLDQDGVEDLVVGGDGDATEGTNGLMRIYRGTSSGPETTPWFEAAASGPDMGFGRLTACDTDVNGDGSPDVLTQEYQNAEGTLRVYLGPLTRGPSASLGVADVVGQTVTLPSATVVGIALVANMSCTVSWGDGASDELAECSSTTLSELSHAYAQPGTYEIRVVATDSLGNVAHGSTRSTID